MNLQTIKLDSGQLSFRSLGSGQRKILFYHGFPGSSAQIKLFEESLPDLDIQVVCFDRLGYNESIYDIKNSQNDTFKATENLIMHLNWNSFEIVCLSGGTPYALNFASQQKKYNLTRISVICGLGYFKNSHVYKHFSALQKITLKTVPFISGKLLKKILTPKKKIEKSAKRNKFFEIFFPVSKEDLHIIQSRNLRSHLDMALTEAVKQNAYGPKKDALFYFSDWGHSLDKIKAPVYFYHGDDDKVISYQVMLEMMKLMPNAKKHIYTNEGHFSLPIKHMKNILQASLS